MTAIDETVILKPGLEPGGRTVTRDIPGVGTLRFEDYPPGTWTTQKGEPAKVARRRYLLDGTELDTVSRIVDTIDKYALREWIEKTATIGAVQAERLGELADVPEEDYVERVKSLNLGASARRDEGADRGKAIHAAFHKLAVEGVVPNPAEFPGVARPWVRGAMRAWLVLDPGEVILAEEPVCHPELGYAGTPDLVAVIDGQVTLIDYKTSKNGRVFEQAHYQTRLYAQALIFCGIAVESIRIIGIGDDGGFEIIDCAASVADVEALLAVHRSRKRIGRDMTAQRRIARAAAA